MADLVEFRNHPSARQQGAQDLQQSVQLSHPEIDWEWVIADELSRQINGGFAVEGIDPKSRNAEKIGYNMTIIRSKLRPLRTQVRLAELVLRKDRFVWLELWSQHVPR